MIVEQNFRIGFRDITDFNKLSNTALLGFLEDAAGAHSNKIGLGFNNSTNSGFCWVLLSWAVEIDRRPIYDDVIKVKTWCRKHEKIYTYRDFEIFDANGEVIGRATSKWVRLDLETKKMLPLSADMMERYGTCERAVFPEGDERIRCKCADSFTECADFKITRNLIDANGHLHNTYYLDVANECIPAHLSQSEDLCSFKILYKKEVKCGDTVKVLFNETPDSYVVTIENEDNTVLHSAVIFNKNQG